MNEHTIDLDALLAGPATTPTHNWREIGGMLLAAMVLAHDEQLPTVACDYQEYVNWSVHANDDAGVSFLKLLSRAGLELVNRHGLAGIAPQGYYTE